MKPADPFRTRLSGGRRTVGRRFHYGWVVASVIFLSLFVGGSTKEIVTVFIRPWTDYFGSTTAAITLAISIQLVLSGPAAIMVGSLTDRFGSRRVFLLLLLLTVMGAIGVFAMKELWQLYLFFGLFLGIGTAEHPVITPLIARWFPKGRGLALGIIQMSDLIGLAILGPMMLTLGKDIGWRVPWLGIGAATLLLVLPLTFFLVRVAPGSPVPGNQAVSSASSSIVQGATLSGASRSRSLWFVMINRLICGTTARYFYLLVAPIAIEGGMGTGEVALTVAITGLMSIPGLLIFGAAADRVNRPKLLGINFIGRSSAFLIMALYLWTNQPWLMFLGAGIAGFLSRSSGPAVNLVMINCFGFRSLGTLLGINTTVHQVAGALSLFAAGLVFDLSGSYVPTILFGASLLAVGAAFAWRIPETKCYSEPPAVSVLIARAQ